MMSDPISTHSSAWFPYIHPPVTLPELACNWHEFWLVSGPVYMPESLGPSRIIIINSKRLYHPIRDMGRPELRIPPYIAIRSPVHPCRDFRKIFLPEIPEKCTCYSRKIPETSRKDGAKIFPKKIQKIASDSPKRAKSAKPLSDFRKCPKSAKLSKCNTAQNFSQNFFSIFFRKFFTKFFLQNRPKC